MECKEGCVEVCAYIVIPYLILLIDKEVRERLSGLLLLKVLVNLYNIIYIYYVCSMSHVHTHTHTHTHGSLA